ncbi:uncharacterized protein PFL1_00043 [Pseudozyma flocculosa PF-1]|uniref:DASH complex subunit DAD2 n=1 Tax=Pseudozyma flocculosa TaxID=84751 RepID=A0A5C3ESM3_9BASI|nr:uncharacterized protein PFL1_00043 [Pseudozyma flocculosa PF-1]EPQ31844.1 hypothetical protein PFL1_00043 [Pseudozyma flocculosa PF-1]SPO35258.1 uncharacterized protein PSFLO_00729 [Pseudozyma flocculosa]
MAHRASMLPPQHGRQSLYPGASVMGGPGGGGGASSQAKLQAKQAELEGLRALRDLSARMAREMERLADQTDTLVEGGDAVAGVMSQWEGVFRAIQIARASTSLVSPPLQYHNPGMVLDTGDDDTASNHSDRGGDGRDNDDDDDGGDERGAPPAGKRVLLDTIVRLPIDLDGEGAADQSNDAAELDADQSAAPPQTSSAT